MTYRSRPFRLSFALACYLSLPTLAQAPAAQTPATAAPTVQPAAATPTADTGIVGDRNRQLDDRIPAQQQLQLQAGDDKFGARYIADLTADHRGAVLVLQDSGQHQSWPRTLAALFDELPQFGWSTLAIELPAPAQDAAPKGAADAPPAANAPTAPANAAQPQNPAPAAPAVADPEAQTQARLDAALAKLADLHAGTAQQTVVIGFGSGAWRTAALAQRLASGNGARNPAPLLALVLVDPRNRLPAATTDLPTLLPATALPALDIVQNSEAQTRVDAEARRRAVLHQKERVYRQIALPPLGGGDAEAPSVLTRRIRGWIQQQTEQAKAAAPAAPSETSAPRP